MHVLAVDTSTAVAAVVVAKDDGILGGYAISHQKTHSQKLLPMIEQLLRELELKSSDIDVFAAGMGPGSFTGIRIGVTTIKALSYAENKPVVGVPTLEILAYNISPGTSLVCPILDARNRQVFTCLYEWKDHAYQPVSETMGVTVDELADIVRRVGRHTVFLGDGILHHQEFFKTALGDLVSVAPNHQLQVQPHSLWYAVSEKIRKGKLTNSVEFQPFYVRPSGAERLAGER